MITKPGLNESDIIGWLKKQNVEGMDFDKWKEVAAKRGYAISVLTATHQLNAVVNRVGDNFMLPDSRIKLTIGDVGQMAYIAGRFEYALKNNLYLMFMTMGDDKVTTPCLVRHGIIRHSTDPFWGRNSPLLHNGCRCILAPLTADEAWARSSDGQGLFANDPLVPADEGWGNNPMATIDDGLEDALRGALDELPEQLMSESKRYLEELLNSLGGA